jgi:WD40 repeat protein
MPNTTTVQAAEAGQPTDRPVIPGYKLLRRIGQGSYGEVWLAQDNAGVYRAVKVVYRRTFEHDRPFEREFSGIQRFMPISRTHSSQVAVLEVGRNPQAGYFYYVMELADDEVTGPDIHPDSYVPKTLRSELKRRGRLSYRECIEIGLALTTALEHLHKHGLIHRDIKPSNIIFVHGVPKLADIGLVTDVAATISYVGTEGFLPPEGPVSPLADIYSLGKVLYEMATGRDRLDFPELPTLPGNVAEKDHLLELNLVFLKACQNDPRKRYRSAHEMHADLALLQSGKSLRQARALERRLNVLARAALAAVLLGGLAFGLYAWRERQQLEQSRREAELEAQAKQLARREAARTLGRLVASHLAYGSNLLSQGDAPRALLWFAEAAREDYPTNFPLHRARFMPLLRRCPKLVGLLAHQGPVHALAFSADGHWLATGSADGTAQLWKGLTGEPAGPSLVHSAAVLCVALSPEARRLAVGCADGAVRLWNPLTGEPQLNPLWHPGPVRRLHFSKDGQWLLSVADEPQARLWSANTGRLRQTMPHDAPVLDAAFSPDGRWVATASLDGTAQLCSLDGAGQSPLRLQHGSPVLQVAFSPDSRRVLTLSSNTARLWQVVSAQPTQWTIDHAGALLHAAFSPDGFWIASLGQDKLVQFWDSRTGQRQARQIELAAPAHTLKFSPDGRHLLVAGPELAQVWSTTEPHPATPPLRHAAHLHLACFSPDGARVATAGADGLVRLVEWSTGLVIESAPEPQATAQPALLHTQTQPGARQLTPTDLTQLAQLLTAHRIEASAAAGVPLPAPEQLAAWQTLRTKWPEAFVPTQPQHWHLRQAELCAQAHLDFAELFHVDRLLAAGGDAAWARRRAELVARLTSTPAPPPQPPANKLRIPPRPSSVGPELIDLGPFYNGSLTETWLPSATVRSGNDLAELPASVQRFNGVLFDARGVIQLSSAALENLGAGWPREINAIPINRKCARLHFLHGAAWDAPFGTEIGGYRVHYADGQTQEIKLVFGKNVRQWWTPPQGAPLTLEAAVAWQGANAASRAVGMAIRLYQMAWKNRRPDVEIRSLDFYSAMAQPAPFLLAITAEAPPASEAGPSAESKSPPGTSARRP